MALIFSLLGSAGSHPRSPACKGQASMCAAQLRQQLLSPYLGESDTVTWKRHHLNVRQMPPELAEGHKDAAPRSLAIVPVPVLLRTRNRQPQLLGCAESIGRSDQ